MYMWLEEMGLVYMPQVKDKKDFETRFELMMRRMVMERLSSQLCDIKTVNIDEVNKA